mmetsp:Transcript_23297/g.66259  ORF Transcript_23297/g.66259 Transcript_23297/m.66259 type:complete len:251 (-) Transcript_23297:39-791(-)
MAGSSPPQKPSLKAREPLRCPVRHWSRPAWPAGALLARAPLGPTARDGARAAVTTHTRSAKSSSSERWTRSFPSQPSPGPCWRCSRRRGPSPPRSCVPRWTGRTRRISSVARPGAVSSHGPGPTRPFANGCCVTGTLPARSWASGHRTRRPRRGSSWWSRRRRCTTSSSAPSAAATLWRCWGCPQTGTSRGNTGRGPSASRAACSGSSAPTSPATGAWRCTTRRRTAGTWSFQSGRAARRGGRRRGCSAW